MGLQSKRALVENDDVVNGCISDESDFYGTVSARLIVINKADNIQATRLQFKTSNTAQTLSA
jgi:hypothetical protein